MPTHLYIGRTLPRLRYPNPVFYTLYKSIKIKICQKNQKKPLFTHLHIFPVNLTKKPEKTSKNRKNQEKTTFYQI